MHALPNAGLTVQIVANPAWPADGDYPIAPPLHRHCAECLMECRTRE